MADQAILTDPKPSVTSGKLPTISGYELLREKGRGPKAIVYKARRIFENDTVGIKLFHRGICDRTMAAKLEAGVDKTADLKHPGLVRALGFGSDGGNAFLVLEYASGESLANFLFRQQQFPPAKALSVVLHFARTLKFAADKGFHHGRLHPGRAILGRSSARICGVGMGERPEHAAWSVQYSHFFEPLIYTAPEAMPSKPFPEQNCAAVDVYSLGAILFHLLTCSPPFTGSDESSLETERRNLNGAVAWPGDSRRAYAPTAVELVEAMLNNDPAKRPNYDNIIQTLSVLQAEAQHSGAEAWHPSDSGTISGRTTHTGMGVFGDMGAMSPAQFSAKVPSSSAAIPSAVPPPPTEVKHAEPHPRQSRRLPVIVARRSGMDMFFSTLLFCMTTTIFVCVAYLTIQPYLNERYQLLRRHAVRPAEPATAPATASANGNGKAAVPVEPNPAIAPETPVDPVDAALALRQLDKVQEMLRDGQILESPGLAKVLRAIAERAGRNSATGIRAVILAGEVESRVASRKALEPVPPPTPPAKPEVPAPSEAPTAKAPEKQPEPPPPAKALDLPKPIPGITAAIVNARGQMKYFGYSKAKEIIEQFAAKGDDEQKRISADFETLVNYEEGLYERCRAKLLEQIKKHPRHESPLQVFPRKDDPVGDDIIDFDEKGLHILVRGGPNKGVKITPWDKFPPVQLLNLMMPLAAPTSIDDQLGLAVFSFNRNLKDDNDATVFLGKAEALPNGKEKAFAIGDIIAKIKRALDAQQ